MARGWESKSVESQQDSASQERRQNPIVSPAERDRRQRVETLKLALAEATSQLQAACKPAYRDMLQQRITAIQQRIEAEGESSAGS